MPAQHLLEDTRPVCPPLAIAIRIPVRLIGAIILGLVAILLVALATWSVDDPSLSYASGKPAQNWLGFPGAVIADISTSRSSASACWSCWCRLALWGWA